MGFVGDVTTTIPIGAGLSSSAALEVATAVALGWDGDSLGLAQLCQRAEQRASGVPCGIMDQLVCAEGSDGGALLIDCGDLTRRSVIVPLPAGCRGRRRALRRVEIVGGLVVCGARARVRGRGGRRSGHCAPRPSSTSSDIDDPVVRARARHVVTENARVR